MGSPSIYWYPAGWSTLKVITLPRLTRLEEVPQPQLQTLPTASLGMVQVAAGIRRQWRFTMERVSMLTSAGRATWREMQGVVSYLQMGGVIGISTDHAKSYAGYPAGGVSPGDSHVVWRGNAFSPWNSSAAPSAGDDLVIEQAPMYGLSECHKVGAFTNTTISLSGSTINFDNVNRSILIRNAGFFPALRMPSDRLTTAITNEHGIIFSLELILEMDAAIYAPVEAYGLADLGLGGTDGVQYQAGGSLADALARRKWSGSGVASQQPRISSAFLLSSSGKVAR